MIRCKNSFLSLIIALLVFCLLAGCASQPAAAPAAPASKPAEPAAKPQSDTATNAAAQKAADDVLVKNVEAKYDAIITPLMEKWKIPGGSVAVTQGGRLVFTKGYGFADTERKELAQPTSLFRIASISKPVTAVAILKLAEEGKVDMDAKAFPLLGFNKSPGSMDPRLYDITVRNLLNHSGGWDRGETFDAISLSDRAARAVGTPAPASADTIVKFMVDQRLDFDPGTKYAYSNFGFCVLGRIIEKITGQNYAEYVKSTVLLPIGITKMNTGRTLYEDRAENEVRYYDYPGSYTIKSVFPNVSGYVLQPYGGFYTDAMDSYGSWIASAMDLVRFTSSIDLGNLLKPATISLMTARPAPPLWVNTAYYYGLGWNVRPVRSDANWWHTGSLPGTYTILVRTYHGFTYAALFNSCPQERGKFGSELDNSLWKSLQEVAQWPKHDLFPQYGYK